MDLKTAVAKLMRDKRLCAHMRREYAKIWLLAAGRHLRQTARDGSNVAEAYELCRRMLLDLNNRLAAQMKVIAPQRGMNLKEAMAKLTGDPRVRTHMEDGYAAIWRRAASEHLRQTTRDQGNIAEAYRVCEQVLLNLNKRLATAQMKAVTHWLEGKAARAN